MDANHNQLLSVLENARSPLSGKQLARILNVSDRTIRAWIKAINAQKKLVFSDNNGYVLKRNRSYEKQTDNERQDFCNTDERVLFIGSQIIFANEPISLYDLADKIYVSYSTIEKDLMRLKKLVKQHHLAIHRSKGKIAIEGRERDKRSFIKYVIKHNNLDIHETISSLLEQMGLSYDSVRGIIKKEFIKHNLRANDYAFLNIMIHLTIALQRISANENNKKNGSDAKTDRNPSSEEERCALDIINNLGPIQGFSFSQIDLDRLTALIQSNTSISSMAGAEKTITNTENEYTAFTRSLIDDIYRHYFIDINDPDFVVFFSCHLKNLMLRLGRGTSCYNPFAGTIYIQNPLIYDIAVFISSRITEEFGYILNRDEITFISLHVGAIIERGQRHKHIKQAILLVSDYNNLFEKSLATITDDLQNLLEITPVYYSQGDLKLGSTNLIINSTGLAIKTELPVVDISPLFSSKDLATIKRFVLSLFEEDGGDLKISNLCRSFFRESCFEKEHYEPTPESMLEYISKRLIDSGLAPKGFTKAVIEREDLTPTSFDNKVAMPHAIQCSTNENCAYVVINKKPMDWGYFKVNIIILLGVEYAQRQRFKEIYSKLIELLDDPTNVEKILDVRDFDEFMAVLTGE